MYLKYKKVNNNKKYIKYYKCHTFGASKFIEIIER